MATKPSPAEAGASASPSKKTGTPKAGWLHEKQKLALIGGALVLAAVLGWYLWSVQGQTPDAFNNFLCTSPKSGILVDLRGSPNQNVSQAMMQCGVNLISSGFFAANGKDLAVYFCDDSGCLPAVSAANSSNSSANASVPFSEALYAMRDRAYFHIRSGPAARYLAHPNYLEVFIDPSANTASSCTIQINDNLACNSGPIPSAAVPPSGNGSAAPARGNSTWVPLPTLPKNN